MEASQLTGWHVVLEWVNDGAHRGDPSKLCGPGQLAFVLPLSMMTDGTNPPSPKFEHQLAFFEVWYLVMDQWADEAEICHPEPFHRTEVRPVERHSASEDNTLRCCVSGSTKWSTQLQADKWYNFANDIDFDTQTDWLWASNGSDPLTQVSSGNGASTSTNSADWHIGELRLDNGGKDSAAEDFYWSGVFIERTPITTQMPGMRQ